MRIRVRLHRRGGNSSGKFWKMSKSLLLLEQEFQEIEYWYTEAEVWSEKQERAIGKWVGEVPFTQGPQMLRLRKGFQQRPLIHASAGHFTQVSSVRISEHEAAGLCIFRKPPRWSQGTARNENQCFRTWESMRVSHREGPGWRHTFKDAGSRGRWWSGVGPTARRPSEARRKRVSATVTAVNMGSEG